MKRRAGRGWYSRRGRSGGADELVHHRAARSSTLQNIVARPEEALIDNDMKAMDGGGISTAHGTA